MNFEECLNKKYLFDTKAKDPYKAMEILVLAEHKLAFLEEVSGKAEKYPSLFIEGYYEILKELGVAILAFDGWITENHDCLFQYLQQKKELELDWEYLAEWRKLRNQIDYRGTKISYTLWRENHLKIKMMIDYLCHYLKEKLKEGKYEHH